MKQPARAPLSRHQRVPAGQLEDAEPLHADWMAAWHTFGGLPELFDAGLAMRHPLQRVRLHCYASGSAAARVHMACLQAYALQRELGLEHSGATGDSCATCAPGGERAARPAAVRRLWCECGAAVGSTVGCAQPPPGVTAWAVGAQGYPLRPELMESTFLLAAATGNASYLEAGRALQATLVDRAARRCGFASLVDVATGSRGLYRGVPSVMELNRLSSQFPCMMTRAFTP